ncbi:hypothetical protein B0T18DRAFT_254742 [Schizothecium vesticola]|uniref:Uncharacterized protein n=1 Tax=Schizothecium vesticola TaxID=314040 RepID=A0AA40EGA8_9PEZI|nr:hypothetical protein B0T18DRAFT_254742 [Schizothecium vesticola]
MRLLHTPLFAFLWALGLTTPAAGTVTPTTLFTLPGPVKPSSWFENLAVRPNGKILATRGDAPEIWQINPATGAGALLVSLAPSTGAFNLTGIAQVHMADDDDDGAETYVFGSSYIPAPLQVEPGSAKVWKLEIGPSGTATVSLLAALPSAGFINGIAEWRRPGGRVLLSDTERAAVYLMDASTGAFTTPLTNLTGINGIRTVRPKAGSPGYLYRVDFFSLTLSRIPIDTATATALGPAQVVADNQLIDDFALAVNKHTGAGAAYLGTMYDNSVVRVVFGPPPSAGPGVKTLVAGNLTGTGVGLCTVVVFGRRPQDRDVLYAAVGQGGSESAKIVKLDLSQL